MTEQTWDVALVTIKGRGVGDGITLHLPSVLARPLLQAGMHRATLTMTEAGILIRPYVAESVGRGPGRQPDVEIPETWS